MMRNNFKLLSKYALFIGYLMILVPIILYYKNPYDLTIKWIFLFFAMCGIFFYFFRIDSRFLIIPAIILLLYSPFLLNYKLKLLAEEIVIYGYYFLIIGVILQIIELFKKNHTILLKFEIIKKVILSRIILLIALFLSVFFAINQLLNFNNLVEATSLYLSTLFLIIHFTHYLME